MGLFDLPLKNKRPCHIKLLALGNGVPNDRLDDPDFYIIYRVGIEIRIISIVLGALTYALTYMHHFYGILPELSILSDHESLLGLFSYMMNIVGGLLCLILIYYFTLFAAHMDFKKYNFLRFGPKKSIKLFDLRIWISVIASPFLILFLILNIGNAIDVLFIYKTSFSPLYDSALFVLIIYFFTSFILGILVQGFFYVYIGFAYTIYEWINLKIRE